MKTPSIQSTHPQWLTPVDVVCHILFIYLFFGPTARHPVGGFHIAKQHSLVLSGLKTGEWCILKQSDAGWEGGRERKKQMFTVDVSLLQECVGYALKWRQRAIKGAIRQSGIVAKSVCVWGSKTWRRQCLEIKAELNSEMALLFCFSPEIRHENTNLEPPFDSRTLCFFAWGADRYFFLSLETLIAALLPK